ncbi:hypothetical protein EAI_09393 [Harpegnathos saltator]|uniref:Uncharacterized protein n=1 Tax=Harpegnathos saltator TaxID=610380 RepID=E2BQH6_HARSA|nr:hypothetical protein EAI_09393 [Harpegnathos saltator]
MAVSYLIGPALVGNTAVFNSTSLMWKSSFSGSAVFNKTHSVALRAQVISLMRIEFVIQFLILMGVLCFFPNELYHSVVFFKVPQRLSLTESILCLLK